METGAIRKRTRRAGRTNAPATPGGPVPRQVRAFAALADRMGYRTDPASASQTDPAACRAARRAGRPDRRGAECAGAGALAGGEAVSTGPGEGLISGVPVADWAVGSDEGPQVALDLVMTPGPRREGLAAR